MRSNAFCLPIASVVVGFLLALPASALPKSSRIASPFPAGTMDCPVSGPGGTVCQEGIDVQITFDPEGKPHAFERFVLCQRCNVLGYVPKTAWSGSFVPVSLPGSDTIASADRTALNAQGAKAGCYNCGRPAPKDPQHIQYGEAPIYAGGWVPDHNPPNIIYNVPGFNAYTQVFDPHCSSCQRKQGSRARSIASALSTMPPGGWGWLGTNDQLCAGDYISCKNPAHAAYNTVVP